LVNFQQVFEHDDERPAVLQDAGDFPLLLAPPDHVALAHADVLRHGFLPKTAKHCLADEFHQL
jgi:hypothetical protein